MTTASNPAQQSKKVLVIEDDTLTRISLCRVLRKMNYETVEACNGYMGIAQFKRERPDVVITDILMPDKEGIATILEIRALDPGACIVAMSGGVEGLYRQDPLLMAEEAGVARTLKKPFHPADIQALMRTLHENQ